MPNDYEKLFSYFKPMEPPVGLLGKIINRLQKERQMQKIRRRVVIFSLSTLGLAVAFIPAFQMVRAGFIESGFLQFFSLIFSDFNIIIAYWQNFAMSLLETMPVSGLIILAAVILAFLESLKFLIKNIKVIFSFKQPLTN